MSTEPKGIWPTMITPFKDNGSIDYDALERLIEWYIERNVDGLFAVCQSSEMFFLNLEERARLSAFVKARAAGRIPVIASGHISDSLEDQVKELTHIAESGADAVILLTNRLAKADETDEVWKANLEYLLKRLPEQVPLGLYECPYPYKRLVSPSLLQWCSQTGRFRFMKDTSCDIDSIKAKLQAIHGGPLKLYNANSATWYETLKAGSAGFSGVMANFHPELYAWLFRNWMLRPNEAIRLADFLSVASMIEKQQYPANAKYYLTLEGITNNTYCRNQTQHLLNATQRLEVEQLRRLTQQISREYLNR